MKESAEIALSHVRAHAKDLGIEEDAFRGKRFHVHVPAGAVPKDGPSAGVTMVSALVSLLRDRPVRPVVGMTGEVTLQGRVLPIGGVKQKVLAAYRAGLTEVVLPARNGPDLEDVPEEVRSKMTFTLAETIGQVLDVAIASEEEQAAAPNGDLRWLPEPQKQPHHGRGPGWKTTRPAAFRWAWRAVWVHVRLSPRLKSAGRSGSSSTGRPGTVCAARVTVTGQPRSRASSPAGRSHR